ncbi:hypothetical protein M2256_002735 [Lactococcus lactis]|uniref:Uncharacterized protein n=1 Tax=Lactococcus lactis TaxID=1358 RepID=A0AAW5TLW2_9LACT|nr:hypothetical protein [Lactococcus lactis]
MKRRKTQKNCKTSQSPYFMKSTRGSDKTNRNKRKSTFLIVLLSNSLYLKVLKKIKLMKNRNRSKKLLMRLEKHSIFYQYKRQVVYPRDHVSFIGTNSLEIAASQDKEEKDVS